MENKNIHDVSDENFDHEVLKAEQLVLVDYWGDGCGPCQMIAPVLEEVANQYAHKIKVVKINVNKNPKTPTKYGVRAVPTLILFKDGDVEATRIGPANKSMLMDFIDKNSNYF
jgi:thioredoxin 1